MAAPTTLAEAIQAAWAADGVLSGLVPATRCYVGKVPPAGSIGDANPATPEMPYARVEIPEGKPGVRSDCNLYAEQPVTVNVWTDESAAGSFDQGDRIGREVERVLSRNLNWGTGGTIDIRFSPHSTIQELDVEIPQWKTVCSFTMTTWQQRTDTSQSSSSSGS